MAHLDRFPHAITPSGECTIHEAVMNNAPITAVKDSDGAVHPPTDADLQLIKAEQDECGE